MCRAGWRIPAAQGMQKSGWEAGCCFRGALLQTAVGQWVTERSAVLCQKGCSSDTRSETVLSVGDILHPRKPQLSLVLSRERVAAMCVRKLRMPVPASPGGRARFAWVGECTSLLENCRKWFILFLWELLRVWKHFCRFFFYYLDRKGVHTAACFWVKMRFGSGSF